MELLGHRLGSFGRCYGVISAASGPSWFKRVPGVVQRYVCESCLGAILEDLGRIAVLCFQLFLSSALFSARPTVVSISISVLVLVLVLVSIFVFLSVLVLVLVLALLLLFVFAFAFVLV